MSNKMNNKQKKLIDVLFLIFVFLFTSYICFFKLSHSYLENWDEAFYAQVTKEMIKNKEPFVLYWNNNLFLDKSPLNFWLNVFFVKIFGLSEFSIRLTSAISGFITIMIVVYLSYRWWGLIPALFTLSTVSLNNLFIWRTRTGNLDSLLSLLFVLSYLLILSKNSKRYILLGIVFGLIYLQKLTIVLLPISIFILKEILMGQQYLKKNLKNYFALFSIFLIITGAWLFIGKTKIGSKFINYYLFKADQGVGKLSLNFFKTDYIKYTYYSLQRRLFYLLLIGIFFLILNIKKTKNLILLIFSVSLPLLLTFTQKSNNWYLVPAIPFWGLTIGYGIKNILDKINVIEKITKINKIKVITYFILLIPLIYISYKTFIVNISSIIDMEASISEVKTAKFVKKISKPNETILRLDFAYPVTLFYSDRKTYYYTTIDSNLVSLIKQKNIRYLLGKKEKIKSFEEFIKNNNEKIEYQIIELNNNDEQIIKIIN